MKAKISHLITSVFLALILIGGAFTIPQLLQENKISPELTLSEASSVGIVINARGTNGKELIALFLNNQPITFWTLTKNFQNYTYTPESEVSIQELSVHFLNDTWEPENNINYDVQIPHIDVNGERYESQSSDILSTGSWDQGNWCAPGNKKTQWLNCNGSFTYNIPAGTVIGIPDNQPPYGDSAMLSPASGASLSGEIQEFTWSDGGNNQRFYDLHVGSAPGESDYYDLNGNGVYAQTRHTATNLPTDGSIVYVKLLWSDDSWATNQIAQYAYTAKKVDTGGGGSIGGDLILENNFSDESTGNYSDSDYRGDADWGDVKWAIWGGRAEIVSQSGDKQMRVTYPKDKYGDKVTGGSGLSRLGQHDELYFRQTVHFEPGFDFGLGGKLPGLVSGEGIWTGCNVPENGEGFSIRYMFRPNGKAVVYAYFIDQVNRSCGDDLDLGLTFKTGVDYTLTQRIKTNSGNDKNGILQVWVSENGGSQRLLLSRSDMRYGAEGRGKIDSLFVTTFHGGNSQDWAPKNTSYARFDDFLISKTKFNDLP